MQPAIIDTHSHLDSKEFEKDLEQVLINATEAGVQNIITVGTDLSSSKKTIELSEKHPWIYSSVGIHPHEVKYLNQENFKDIIKYTDHPRVRAVGETGLDYFYKHSPPETQIRWFREHIRLARISGLPLVIHSRNAKEETLLILEEERAFEVGGVLHCFTGDQEMAEKGIDMGFYISFSGIVTFPKAKDIQEVAKTIPLDRILIETDCPFLTPVPHRGKRNEPGWVQLVASKIAELRGVSLEEIALTTTDNAVKLFGIKK